MAMNLLVVQDPGPCAKCLVLLAVRNCCVLAHSLFSPILLSKIRIGKDTVTSYSVMAPKANGKKYLRSSSYKRTHNGKDGEWNPWANIIPELLIQIMMHLELADYFSFSRVCHSWRSVALSERDIFLCRKEPLALTFSPPAGRSCILNNVFSGRYYEMLLPSFSGKHCVGVSSGYLIMLDGETRVIWLVNFITRHKLCFPALPDDKPINIYSFRTILVYSKLLLQFVLVVLFPREKHIIFSTSGAAAWSTIFPYLKPESGIVDLIAFKGKIYFIDSFSRIGEMSLYPSVVLRLLDISKIPMNIPIVCSNFIQLVTSAGRLFFVQIGMFVVFELDIEGMQWVEIKDLGGGTLFVGGMFKGSSVVDIKKWGDHWNPHSDQIHYLQSPLGIRLSSGRTRENVFIHESPLPSMWFFPHESFDANDLD